MSEVEPALRDAFGRLGKREFMRQVATLIPINLDDPTDETVYIDYLIERGALILVGWQSPVTGNLLKPGPLSQKDWAADMFKPVYAVARELDT